MAVVPGEIQLINRNGARLWAHYTGVHGILKDTYQYRLNSYELVVVDVSGQELRDYCRTNRPIAIPEQLCH